MSVKPLDLDEMFKGWINLWEFWGPSAHLFRSVNIIEIAYTIVELDVGEDPYGKYDDLMAWERLLRKIIKDKLINQYRRPDDDQAQTDAYGLAARLFRYCHEHPRTAK